MLDISWREATLHLAKCVDYYFVEYAELANGTAIHDNTTQFRKIGVQLTRKNVTELREFVEQSIENQQRWTKYAAQIRSVQYNTTYVIRVRESFKSYHLGMAVQSYVWFIVTELNHCLTCKKYWENELVGKFVKWQQAGKFSAISRISDIHLYILIWQIL